VSEKGSVIVPVVYDSAVSVSPGVKETSASESVLEVVEHTLSLGSLIAKDNLAMLHKEVVENVFLNVAKELATKDMNSHSWEDGLVLRVRLDEQGKLVKQICISVCRRKNVMTLALERFGHLSNGKVIAHIQQGFYWTTLRRDVAAHCRSCEVCQRVSKAVSKKAPMKVREIVSIPFE